MCEYATVVECEEPIIVLDVIRVDRGWQVGVYSTILSTCVCTVGVRVRIISAIAVPLHSHIGY